MLINLDLQCKINVHKEFDIYLKRKKKWININKGEKNRNYKLRFKNKIQRKSFQR